MELLNSEKGAFENLLICGDDAIDWLVENYFPMLDPFTLKVK